MECREVKNSRAEKPCGKCTMDFSYLTTIRVEFPAFRRSMHNLINTSLESTDRGYSLYWYPSEVYLDCKGDINVSFQHSKSPDAALRAICVAVVACIDGWTKNSRNSKEGVTAGLELIRTCLHNMSTDESTVRTESVRILGNQLATFIPGYGKQKDD